MIVRDLSSLLFSFTLHFSLQTERGGALTRSQINISFTFDLTLDLINTSSVHWFILNLVVSEREGLMDLLK